MPFARQLVWVAVAASLALVVRSLWFEPLPGIWAALALTSVLLLLLIGTLVPRFEMFGDILWCAPTGRDGVALTFDDGPDPETTRAVLSELAKADAKATFFVIGAKAQAHPDVIRAIHEAGHSLGIHTWSHQYWYAFKTPTAVRNDIRRCQELLRDITGETVSLFRPPVGQLSPRTAAGAKRAGATVVGWAIRSGDGIKTSPEKVLARVERGLADGAVILLHDAAERGGREPASVAALPALLELIQRRGLRCVPLSEWTKVE